MLPDTVRPLAFLLALSLPLAVAACDTSETGSGTAADVEAHYRTPQVDGAHAAIRGPSGGVVVTGLTEGRIGLGDWTNGFPLVFRVHPDGTIADTTVYRDVRYGRAVDAAPLERGFAVLVEKQRWDQTGVEPPALTLYRTGPDGTRQDVLFRPDSAFTALDPLHRTADGGLLLAISRTGTPIADLVKLDRSGAVMWTYRMPDVPYVQDVAEAPGGDLYVLGHRDAPQFELARLAPDGTAQWQRTYGSDTTGTPLRTGRAVAATDDGATVLGTRDPVGPDAPLPTSVVLTHFDRGGAFVEEESYATGPVQPSALTTLPDERLALSYAEDYGDPDAVSAGQTRSVLLLLGADGAVQQRWRFGPRRGTTRTTALVPLGMGHLAAVGSSGPAAIGGFGGDDFDVLTAIYQTE